MTLQVVPDEESNVITFPAPGPWKPARASTRRARRNRQRAAVADRPWPGRREDEDPEGPDVA